MKWERNGARSKSSDKGLITANVDDSFYISEATLHDWLINEIQVNL